MLHDSQDTPHADLPGSVTPGRVITGLYPRHNIRGVRGPLLTRRVLVSRIRDLTAEPLDPLTVSLNPLIDRGRWLVYGTDLDTGAERQFYLDSFRNWKTTDLAEALAEAVAANPAPYTVAVIDRPAGWSPSTSADVPPNVTLFPQANPRLAAVFAERFNEEELVDGCGRWAVQMTA